jgi:hypothetical protein
MEEEVPRTCERGLGRVSSTKAAVRFVCLSMVEW